jgi:hypothetical protein
MNVPTEELFGSIKSNDLRKSFKMSGNLLPTRKCDSIEIILSLMEIFIFFERM